MQSLVPLTSHVMEKEVAPYFSEAFFHQSILPLNIAGLGP